MEDQIWSQSANIYVAGSKTSQMERLPSGLYHFEETQRGWHLRRLGDRFEFPYKLYAIHEEIIQQTLKAWESLPSNLGILLNGVKGTGKTITAQVLMNHFIDRGFPVLVVPSPVPLDLILGALAQDVVVMFDEFEKTHNKPEFQQQTLSAIDGMSRSLHRRLFLFTTNTPSLDDNFVDRPSRIRYVWTFNRLGDRQVVEIVDDLLDPSLKKLRSDLLAYLEVRKVLTIDAVKASVQDTNIFRTLPAASMNLSQRDPTGFQIEILEKVQMNWEPSQVFAERWVPNRAGMGFIRKLIGPSGPQELQTYVDTYGGWGATGTGSNESRVTFLAPLDGGKPGDFLAYLQTRPVETWLKMVGYHARLPSYVTLDRRPEDWKIPRWAKMLADKKDLVGEDDNDFEDWLERGTVYGTPNLIEIPIRVTPLYSAPYRPLGGPSWPLAE